MPPTRRTVLQAVAAGSAGLAGCAGGGGGGADGDGDGDMTPTATPESTPMATDSPTDGSPTVQLSTVDPWGSVLTDADGLTLYLFARDSDGESVCYDECAENWPPLTVEGDPTAGSGVEGDLGTTERDDGSTQVTLGGWPLYYFAPDEGPGDAKGQALGDVWWLVDAAGDPVRPTVWTREHESLGDILVGPNGHTLYMFDRDTQGEGASACSDDCADNWPPLTVEGDPTAAGDVDAALTTFERGDGSTQVAADGWPLYYFAPDEAPGDAKGQGVGDVWWVLGPDGSVIRATPTPTETDQDPGY